MGAKQVAGSGRLRQQACYPLPTGNWKVGGSLILSFMPKQDKMRLTFSLLLGMMNGKHEGGNGVALITPEPSSVAVISATPVPTVPEPPLGSDSTSYSKASCKKDSGTNSLQRP